MTLEAKNIDFVCLSQTYDEILQGWFDRDYQPRLEKSGIPTREILPGPGKPVKTGNRNRVRFLPDNSVCETDMVIFGDTVILVAYAANDPYAVILQDELLAQGFKVRFEALWQGLA